MVDIKKPEEEICGVMLPGRYVTMDESLFSRGRFGWVQYIQLGTARFGKDV
jgi:hypothetical protein